MITVPEGALQVMQRLQQAGYEAYVVGGCVRDSLLGLEPKDWDICTSATPREMLEVFRGMHTIETGLQHGTVTVMLRHVPYEVTAFRLDGAYTDHRHPDEVTFIRDVVRDLARRDFTVNAMAYHPDTGLVDPFGGREDLAAGVIRCVGNAEERFREDALRILRAMRFASVYGFTIEPETDLAIHALYPTLEQVAAERVRSELGKLLCGKQVGAILRAYTDVITWLFPELKASVGFEQRTIHHRYTVWEHIIRTVEAVAPTEVLRLAMLFHDSGKPACFTVDENGAGHAYGHAKVSMVYAEAAFARLKLDRATHDRAMKLIEVHDIHLEADRHLMLRRLSQFGEEVLRQLIDIHRADAMGKGTKTQAEIDARTEALYACLDALLAEKPCFSLKNLAINGQDLLNMGYPKGPALGECLGFLLEEILEERLPNERKTLLETAERLLREKCPD